MNAELVTDIDAWHVLGVCALVICALMLGYAIGRRNEDEEE